MRPERLRQRAFKRPAPSQPDLDDIRVQSLALGGIAHRKSGAAPCDHRCSPLVPRLLLGGCPPDVARPIATRVVLSVYGMLRRRLRANVGEKVFEPATSDVSRINVYSTAAPKIPALVTRVRGPGDHGRPTLVFAGHFAVGLMPVGGQHFSRTFSGKASAGASGRELRATGDGFAAAVANTPPHPDRATVGVAPVWSAFNNSQSADAAAGQVNGCWHD